MEVDERRWEEFKLADGSRRSYLLVSINKRGVITLNAFAMQRMGFPTAVVLYYDRPNSSIGIRPEEPDAQNSLPVRMRSSRDSGQISAISFLRYYRIKIRDTIVSDHLEIDDAGMLIVDLRHTRELRPKRQDPATGTSAIQALTGQP